MATTSSKREQQQKMNIGFPAAVNYQYLHIFSVLSLLAVLLGLQSYMESSAGYSHSLLTMMYYEKEWSSVQLWGYRAAILVAATVPLLIANYVDELHAKHRCCEASKQSKCFHRR